MDSNLVVQVISQVGISGVLVWYLYHTTTKTIPDLCANHQEAIDAMQKQYVDSLEKNREALQREIGMIQDNLPVVCRYSREAL